MGQVLASAFAKPVSDDPSDETESMGPEALATEAIFFNGLTYSLFEQASKLGLGYMQPFHCSQNGKHQEINEHAHDCESSNIPKMGGE